MKLTNYATLFVAQWNLLAVKIAFHIFKWNHLTFQTLKLNAWLIQLHLHLQTMRLEGQLVPKGLLFTVLYIKDELFGERHF